MDKHFSFPTLTRSAFQKQNRIWSLGLGVLIFSMILVLPHPITAQIPSLPSAPPQSKTIQKPPENVTRYGDIEIAEVRSPITRKELFVVASPSVLNRQELPDGKIPVEIRATEIEGRLDRIKDLLLQKNDSFQEEKLPKVEISRLNNRIILQLSIDKKNISRPFKLVTVTEPDANYYGKTLDQLALEWQQIIQEDIDENIKLFSPGEISQRVVQGTLIIFTAILASMGLWYMRKLVNRKLKILDEHLEHKAQTKLQDEEQTSGALKADEDDSLIQSILIQRNRFLSQLPQMINLRRKQRLLSFINWLLTWVIVLIWYSSIILFTTRTPWLMRYSSWVIVSPLQLIIIWFLITLAIRISHSLIDSGVVQRLTQGIPSGWTAPVSRTEAETQRRELQAATISGALGGLSTFVFVIVGIVWTLDVFGIPTSSILAGTAIIGLAISFGSQSLVKDLVNGCLIIVEDQFAIGDVVNIDGEGGLVENLNLRITQLRNSEGQLITIPNSMIAKVSNLTRLWSRVDFAIEVAYESNIDRVTQILNDVAQQLYQERGWHERIVAPPEVLGVDHLSSSGMLIRVWLKTAPLQQWNVGREYRRRVRLAFGENQIQPGRPERITYAYSFPESTS